MDALLALASLDPRAATYANSRATLEAEYRRAPAPPVFAVPAGTDWQTVALARAYHHELGGGQ